MAAAVAQSSRNERAKDIFASVFPRQTFTTPTPEATPNIGSTSPGRSFGGFNLPSNAASDAARSARIWSTATRYLTLTPGSDSNASNPDHDVWHAVSTLFDSSESRQELVAWYQNEVGVHFRHFVLPELQVWNAPIAKTEASSALLSTVQVLQQAQKYYLGRIDQLLLLAREVEMVFSQRLRDVMGLGDLIKDRLRTLVLNSLPKLRLQNTLASVFYHRMVGSLEGSSNRELCLKKGSCRCAPNLKDLRLAEMREVGLGGAMAERAFAYAVHRFLERPAIERRCFEVDWVGQTSTVWRLRLWVEEIFVPFVRENLAAITGQPLAEIERESHEQFTIMAVRNLGRLRTETLFDYVKSWPASSGAITDIWEHLNAGPPAEKAFVCDSFSEQVQRRILHAGATTAEILSVYVNVIHTFNALDSRGVLLERVAKPIRNYLRSRDDAVNIIAASFLADVDTECRTAAADANKICFDITAAVANSTPEAKSDEKTLNWDDMEWVPDPIDASPEYKSSKSEDIISYVLGNLFEAEEFIKEVTNVLAQHLLHATDTEYIKETRLIELFKSRLDSTKLQAAEVMLKDVRDSVSLGKRINPLASYGNSTKTVPKPPEIQAAIPYEGITLPALYTMFEDRISRPQFVAAMKLVASRRGDLFYPKRTSYPQERTDTEDKEQTNFKVQVLSSYFWPQLRSNEFLMPDVLEPIRAQFSFRFDNMGSQRKLHFRPALARTSIRLEFEDRVVEEADIPAWRASVIDAFGSEWTAQPSDPIIHYDDSMGLSAEQLVEVLQMEEELVQDGLNFWLGKNVLYQRAPGVYAVRERMDMDIGAIQQRVQVQQSEMSAVKSQDALLKESAPMFETFILNMLRNQGAKEVGGMMGITGLLKMVLPSFTYGDEEVVWLLGEMEGRGEVRREGEKWVVVQ